MPRRAARIILEITDVRIERLRDITESDAKKEGVFDIQIIEKNCDQWDYCKKICEKEDCNFQKYITCFKNYWNILNEDRGYDWKTNPWVYAVTFKPVSP
jgi:hypothetical protein